MQAMGKSLDKAKREKQGEKVRAMDKVKFDAFLENLDEMKACMIKQIELLDQLENAMLIYRYPDKYEAWKRDYMRKMFKKEQDLMKELREHNKNILNNLGD